MAETATAATESIQRETGEEGFSLEDVLTDSESEERMLEKIALRQAISRAVERVVVAETLLAGQADVARLPLPPDSELYDETLADELDYSLADATRLLADGGYALNGEGALALKQGTLPALRLLVTPSPSKAPVALVPDILGPPPGGKLSCLSLLSSAEHPSVASLCCPPPFSHTSLHS